MSETSFKGRLTALALVAPLVLFLAIFFAWPLATMLKESVSDPVGSRAFPLTADVAGDWDRQSDPPEELKQAFVDDLRAIDDQQLLGDAVRRLNSAQNGFRTLMSRTAGAGRSGRGRQALVRYPFLARCGRFNQSLHRPLSAGGAGL
jgi:putative spermidine/putrescine transport system permease protein